MQVANDEAILNFIFNPQLGVSFEPGRRRVPPLAGDNDETSTTSAAAGSTAADAGAPQPPTLTLTLPAAVRTARDAERAAIALANKTRVAEAIDALVAAIASLAAPPLTAVAADAAADDDSLAVHACAASLYNNRAQCYRMLEPPTLDAALRDLDDAIARGEFVLGRFRAAAAPAAAAAAAPSDALLHAARRSATTVLKQAYPQRILVRKARVAASANKASDADADADAEADAEAELLAADTARAKQLNPPVSENTYAKLCHHAVAEMMMKEQGQWSAERGGSIADATAAHTTPTRPTLSDAK